MTKSDNYYLKNCDKLREKSRLAYHKMIDKFTDDELMEFRNKKRVYFRNWYFNKKKIYYDIEKEECNILQKVKKTVKKKKHKSSCEIKKESISLAIIINIKTGIRFDN